MPHNVTYNSELHMVESKYQGDVTLNEIKEHILEIIKVAKEQNCFFLLNDFREATMRLSTFDIYELPKIISGITTSSEIPVYKFKRALVVKKDLRDYDFFETVTANNAQRNKLFQDIDKAREWLLEQ